MASFSTSTWSSRRWLLLFFVLVLECESAPFLLGNQMTSLSVIPRTEEQAAALLEFLQNNPQYGNNASSGNVQVNTQEWILIPNEDLSKLNSDLQEIGLRFDNSSMYQTS